MSYVIAGVVLLLSVVVGVASVYAANATEKNSENGDGRATDVIKTASAWAKDNWRRLAFVLCVSFALAALSVCLYTPERSVLDLCRRVAFAELLLSAMIIDFKTHLIPNYLIIGSFGLWAVLSVLEFIFVRDTFNYTILAGIVGGIGCFVILYILSRLTHGGIGMGDVKLISAAGLYLGLFGAMLSLMFSLILCAIVSAVLLITKHKNKNDSVPFGPFVFFGYMIMSILMCL